MSSRSAFLRALPLVAAALMLLPTPDADASRSLYSFTRVQQGFTSICQQGGPDIQDAEAHCVVPPLSGFIGARGDAEAHSLYGRLRVYTRLETLDADGRNHEVNAHSAFTDSLRIQASGHPFGSTGSLRLDFTVDVTHNIYERILTGGTVGPRTDFFLRINGNSSSPNGTIPNLYFFYPFKYGIPFEIEATVITKVTCSSCSGRYDVETDGLSTATLDVVSVSGLALNEFYVFNESGEFYANVVPEPGALASQLAAVVTLGALVARRRRPLPRRAR